MSYNSSYTNTYHRDESKGCNRKMCSKKFVMKHAQSGTILKLEVIIRAY
jgi:hypothetical protein